MNNPLPRGPFRGEWSEVLAFGRATRHDPVQWRRFVSALPEIHEITRMTDRQIKEAWRIALTVAVHEARP